MKLTINCIIVFTIIFSCQTNKKSLIIQKKDENVNILITPDYRNLNKNFLVSIPRKFKILKNEKNNFFMILLKKDNQLLNQIQDYIFYNEKGVAIYDIEKKRLLNDLVINITYRDLSFEKSLLNKKYYHLIDKIKLTDTIKIPYEDFKKSNPQILNKLNKRNDSLIFRTEDFENRIKVNW